MSAEEINWKDQYIRLAADFDNYKKNKEKEIEAIKKTASKELVLELIRTIDETIIAYSSSKDPDGFRIIYHNLMVTLKKYGVEQYGEVGDTFDPELHDGIAVTADGKVDKGCISFVAKYGFKMNGEIIRHAQVMVER